MDNVILPLRETQHKNTGNSQEILRRNLKLKNVVRLTISLGISLSLSASFLQKGEVSGYNMKRPMDVDPLPNCSCGTKPMTGFKDSMLCFVPLMRISPWVPPRGKRFDVRMIRFIAIHLKLVDLSHRLRHQSSKSQLGSKVKVYFVDMTCLKVEGDCRIHNNLYKIVQGALYLQSSD